MVEQNKLECLSRTFFTGYSKNVLVKPEPTQEKHINYKLLVLLDTLKNIVRDKHGSLFTPLSVTMNKIFIILNLGSHEQATRRTFSARPGKKPPNYKIKYIFSALGIVSYNVCAGRSAKANKR
jgi:hypothetical protein